MGPRPTAFCPDPARRQIPDGHASGADAAVWSSRMEQVSRRQAERQWWRWWAKSSRRLLGRGGAWRDECLAWQFSVCRGRFLFCGSMRVLQNYNTRDCFFFRAVSKWYKKEEIKTIVGQILACYFLCLWLFLGTIVPCRCFYVCCGAVLYW